MVIICAAVENIVSGLPDEYVAPASAVEPVIPTVADNVVGERGSDDIFYVGGIDCVLAAAKREKPLNAVSVVELPPSQTYTPR